MRTLTISTLLLLLTICPNAFAESSGRCALSLFAAVTDYSKKNDSVEVLAHNILKIDELTLSEGKRTYDAETAADFHQGALLKLSGKNDKASIQKTCSISFLMKPAKTVIGACPAFEVEKIEHDCAEMKK